MQKSAKSTEGNQRKRASGRCPNYLPPHVATSFQSSLDELIAYLGKTEGFKGEYLADQYASKYADPKGCTPEQREAAAIQKWLSAERTNRATNERLMFGDVDLGYANSDQVLAKAAAMISDVLGCLDYSSVFNMGSHSNGASTRIKRSPTSMVEKYTGEAHVSESALTHWVNFARDSILEPQEMELFNHSVMFTVPKATDIDRVACKEPEINMFLQKSIGQHIRRRLKLFGQNLNDQEINKGLARTAVQNNMATIDLSAASDSITTQLVMQLLPPDWFFLLDDLRVKRVMIDEETEHMLEMFSSMGNGFTFELESLIFWALAQSIKYYSGIRGRVSVYGDDIIVPNDVARRLARTFSFFGFKVNTKKSAWSGQFRESCGGHYYGGRDVTPFYLREPVKTKSDVIRLLNRLSYWDLREVGFITNFEIYQFHKKWSSIIPQSLWGGQSYEDITSLVTGHSPRYRLVQTDGDPCDSDDLARIKCWFVNRRDVDSKVFTPLSPGAPVWLQLKDVLDWSEDYGLDCLSYELVEEGPWVVEKQPAWLERTSTDPWLLEPGVIAQ